LPDMARVFPGGQVVSMIWQPGTRGARRARLDVLSLRCARGSFPALSMTGGVRYGRLPRWPSYGCIGGGWPSGTTVIAFGDEGEGPAAASRASRSARTLQGSARTKTPRVSATTADARDQGPEAGHHPQPRPRGAPAGAGLTVRRAAFRRRRGRTSEGVSARCTEGADGSRETGMTTTPASPGDPSTSSG